MDKCLNLSELQLDGDSTYLIVLLEGLNEIIYVKFVAHSIHQHSYIQYINICSYVHT